MLDAKQIAATWRTSYRAPQTRRLTLAEVMRDLATQPGAGRELLSRLREPDGLIWASWHDLDAAEVTPHHVEAWQRALLASGRAPKTVWTLRSLLSLVLAHAVELGACERNPVRDARTKTLGPNEPRDPDRRALEVLLPGEAQRVVDARDLQLRPTWTALLCTGLRIGELAGLSWRDVARGGRPLGELLVRSSWDGHTKVLGPTKTRRPRRVPIHPALAEALNRQVDWYRVRAGRLPRADDPVFPADRIVGGQVERWSRQTALRRWRRDLEALGIAEPAAGPRSLHSTRHTFATSLYRAGASWRCIQSLTHSLGRQAADGCVLPTYIHAGWQDLCDTILRLPYGQRAQTHAV